MTTTDNFEFDELDELAAAYLDGEATPAEIERVESDPEIQARVEEFRELTEAIAAPVTPPSATERDAAVAEALAAFTTAADDTNETSKSTDLVPVRLPGSETTATPIGSLDAARSRRAARSGSRLAVIAKVAAAVMVVFVGLTVLIQAFDGNNGDEFATSATDAVSDASSDVVDTASDAAGDVADEAAMDGDDAMATGAADDAMENDAMEDDTMENDAMEEEAMEESAMDEGAMDEGAMENDAMEEEANDGDANDDAATSSSDANATDTAADADADTVEQAANDDAEAGLVLDGAAKAQYLLPDDAIANRPDYLGDFDSFDELVLDYRPASEGIAPRFVTPTEFSACDLTTLLPTPRAMLFIGTATIDGTQRLVGLEPANNDRVIIFGQTDEGECAVVNEAPMP